MFNDLTGLGYGLVVFAIGIGVGALVLSNFGSSVAGCSGSAGLGTWTYNTSSGECANTSHTQDSASIGAKNSYYLLGQLGESGLAGWTPAIIAMAVGLLFLGAFMLNGGKKKGRY